MPRRRKTPKEGEETSQGPHPPPSQGRAQPSSTSQASSSHGHEQQASGGGRLSVPPAQGRGRGDARQSAGHGQTPIAPGSTVRMQVPDLPQAVSQPFSPPAYTVPTGEAHPAYGRIPSVHSGRSPPAVPVQVPSCSYPGIQQVGRPSGVPPSVYQPISPTVGGPFGSLVEGGPSESISDQLGKLRLPSSLASTEPVLSSKSLRFPLRPGNGQTGIRCTVKANHFLAALPDKDLHQYDVSINPEVTSRGVNRAVMDQLVKLHRDTALGRRLPAYDGRKSLYTAGPLPFQTKE
eukprot:c27616_g1_i1 orf=609-1481(+)